jgi:hypothetical protein
MVAAIALLALGVIADNVSLATQDMSDHVPLLWFALGCFVVSGVCLVSYGLNANRFGFALCILAGVLLFDQAVSAVLRLSS